MKKALILLACILLSACEGRTQGLYNIRGESESCNKVEVAYELAPVKVIEVQEETTKTKIYYSSSGSATEETKAKRLHTLLQRVDNNRRFFRAGSYGKPGDIFTIEVEKQEYVK